MTRLEIEPTRARRRGPVGHLAHILLWIIVLALLLFTGWRLFGPDSAWPVAVAMAYTPYVLVACLIPILLAIGLRAGRLLAVTVLCTCVLAALLVPRVFGGTLQREGATVTIMTANVDGSETNLTEAAAIAADGGVDVLLLQGVTAGLADEADKQLGPLLPHEDHSGTTFVYSTHEVTADGQQFDVDLGDDEAVRLVSADLPKPTNRDSFARWREGFAELPSAEENDGARTVIAGTFHATLDHATLRDLLDSGYTDATEAVGEKPTQVWDFRGKPKPFAPQHLLAGPDLHVSESKQYELPDTASEALVSTLVLVED